MQIKRREFLKYVGFTAASAGAAGWAFDSLHSAGSRGEVAATATKPLIPGAESWIPSVCQLCPSGCGIRVRLVDNIPVKIEGNPLYPINRGGLCPTGQAGLQILYSPNRIKTPLKRIGERGARQWKAISWDEALDTIIEKLHGLRSADAQHKVVFLDGGARGLVKEMIQRFLTVYGTPNYIDTSNRRNAVLPFLLTQGEKDVPVFDVANTNYVLSFGADLLEAEGAPVWQYRMYSHLREGKNGVRGKLVVVDPRFSITAAKADKWIPINPGTEGALALGIAYVLVQEELYNKSFVEQFTFGFDDWKDKNGTSHLGFRSLLLKNYYPEAVATITGVPIEDIFRIARGFAASQPGVAMCGRGADAYSNGLYTQFAVHSLNVLVGNLERAGGVLQATEPPLASLLKPSLDKEAETSLRRGRVDEAGTARFPFAFDVPSALPKNILSGHPYDVQLLFLYNSNPLFESPNQSLWKKAFEKVPFVVGIGSFFSESTEMADLILPEHTYLEQWGDEWGAPNVGFSHFGLRRPVVNPLHDTKNIGDVIIAMAKKFGSPISQPFPFDDFLSLMKHAVEGIFKSGRGAIASATFEEAMMGYLKERGWRYPGPKTFEEFWKSLVENGGWFDTSGLPRPLQHAFQTESGKFEFYVQHVERTLQKQVGKTAPKKETEELESLLQALNIQSRGDEMFLPHYEEAAFSGNESLFPLYLKPFRVNTLMDGSAANTPAMMEMVGFRNYERWNSWVEINPETAAKLGINDGDNVWVESSIGKLKTKAKVFVGAMSDVVSIPLGMGHTVGRFAKQHGVNPMELLASEADPLSGVTAIGSTRVKVYKA